MSSVSLELLVPIEVNACGYQFHLELLKCPRIVAVNCIIG